MANKQEYVTDKDAAAFVEEFLTKKAKAHEPNFANAREARNYLERCIQRQATRIVSIENISDDDLKTLTIDDVKE